MEILLAAVLFAAGLLLIVKGGDVFVDAAVWTARASGMPPFLIGATIVSLATTLPELLVSLFAAAQGNAGMAVGNAVGSVTANTGLILGVALLFLPHAIRRSQYLFQSLLLIGAMAVLLALSWLSGGQLPALWSAVLLLFLFAYLWNSVRTARREQAAKEDRLCVERKCLWQNVCKFVLGAAALAVGSQLLVDNGSALASAFGVPDGLIAVTLVAVGTSLPELVTTLTAVRKRQASLSVGNILGANLIDTCLILPASSLLAGGTLAVSPQAMAVDMPVCLLLTLIGLVPALCRSRFSRWQGALMLSLYLGYLVWMVAAAV